MSMREVVHLLRILVLLVGLMALILAFQLNASVGLAVTLILIIVGSAYYLYTTREATPTKPEEPTES